MAITYNPRIVTDGLVLCLDPGNVKGYDSTENLLLYSEDFSNAYWTKSNVSVTANAITSPTGSSNASKLVESASTAVHELIRNSDPALSVATDTYITFSIFVKAAERQYCYIRSSGNSKRIAVVVDLSNGTFNVTNWSGTLNSSATVTAYPNGWYRITATSQSNYAIAPGWAGNFVVSPLDSYQIAGNVGGAGYSYAGDGTSGIYIWGAHYELGPGISNYYATAGTAKTRGTTLSDLSGRGNNGTLTNGPTFSSANGGSIVFDAVDDRFSGSFVCNKTYYSVDFWCYPTALTDYNWAIGFNSFWGDFGLHTTVSGGVYVGTSVASRISPWRNNVFVLNTWQNFTWTFDNGTAKFYKNGVLETSANLALSASTEFTSYNGGGGGAASNCTGRLSIFKVYSNKVLTATEITQNFNALRGRFGI